MGGLSDLVGARSSTAGGLRSLPLRAPAAGVPVSCTAAHKAFAVGFRCLDQAVKLHTGLPPWRATEQPVLSADDKGADGTLGGLIVDRQVAVLDVAFLPAPVAGQIAIALLNAF